MTEASARRCRLSRGALRAIAWVAGGAAFAVPFAGLTLSPKPATAQAGGEGRRLIIIERITRRVIVQTAPQAPQVRYVYVDGGSSGSSGGGGSSAPAAAPPPATTTGGS
jgi:hypothetical protein